MVDLDFKYNSLGWEQHILKDMPSYPLLPEWYEKGKKGDPLNVCVDVGANVGIFTAYHQQLFKRFICIEASRSNCKRMESNFTKLGVQNAQIERAAAWSDSTSGFKLGYGTKKNRPGDCKMWTKDSPHKDHETVPTLSLEDLLKKYSLDSVDLLKVDIEGSEYEFLYGKDLSKINNLVVELHPAEVGKENIKKLVDHIMSHSYKAVRKRDDNEIAGEIAQATIQHGNPRQAPKSIDEIEFLEEVTNLESLQYVCSTILFTK